MGPKPRGPKLQAINTAYLQDRSFACDQYEDVGKEAGPESDDEVFAEYGIRRDECQVATFIIAPREVEAINNILAQIELQMEKLWAALVAERNRAQDLSDVLEQVRDFQQQEID